MLLVPKKETLGGYDVDFFGFEGGRMFAPKLWSLLWHFAQIYVCFEIEMAGEKNPPPNLRFEPLILCKVISWATFGD